MDGWAELRSAVRALSVDDPTGLPAAVLADRVVELRTLLDALEGVWSRLVGVLDGSGAVDDAAGTGAWLRAACRLSAAEARSRVVLARRLGDRPQVGAALASGTISVGHARLVTTALAELEAAAGPELATATEAPLLEAARRCDPARLRREIAHARHALVPVAAAEADERLRARRHLDVATTFEGTVVVNGVLDPEGGEALLTALAPLSAPSGPEDGRTPGQRRADALVELCRQRLDAGTLPALGGERPHLTVLVPLAALAGLPPLTAPAVAVPAATASTATASTATASTATASTATASTAAVPAATVPAATAPAVAGDPDAGVAPKPPGAVRSDTPVGAGRGGGGTGPAPPVAGEGPPGLADGLEMPAASAPPGAGGHGGMVGAETVWGAVLGPQSARRLACDASVTRVVLGPASQPLDVGRRTRVVPPAVRTALVVRDRGCVAPGCDRPSPWTDAHHVRHWADGGPTALDNLVLLCRRHHRAVHEGNYTITRDRGGRWRVEPPARAGAGPGRAA